MKALQVFVFLALLLGEARATEPEVLCSNLSDSFCEELWSPTNNGNLKTEYGPISLGKSPKSHLSLIEKMDIETFIRSARQFPAELSGNRDYLRIVAKLQRHLKEENPSKLWREKLRFLYDELSMHFNLIHDQSFVKAFPHLKTTPENDYQAMDWLHFIRTRQDLGNRIVEAKIRNSPNWKRVEKVFAEVRRDTLEVISQLTLSENEKAKIRARVSEVELSLPYADPELMGAEPDCSKHALQAFYNYFLRRLTVCAGYFNGFQTEPVLRHILAHELAHSMDISQYAINRSQDLPIGKSLRELLNYEGPITSCKAWNEMVATGVWKAPPSTEPEKHEPFTSFKACLVDKTRLKPFTFDALSGVVQLIVDGSIHQYAQENTFSLLVTPEITKEGKTRPNDFYLRPDLKALRDAHYFQTYKLSDGAPTLHFFVYSLLCEPGKDEPRNITALAAPLKRELFVKAIHEARSLSVGHLMKTYENCGDECKILTSYQLAATSGENFADWVANKVTAMELARQEPSKRREYIRQIGAELCVRPARSFDPDLMIAEKFFSREPHEERRIRRRSIISPAAATLVGCRLEENQRDLNRCQL